ncbi:putative RloB domain-containing protein [Azospirillaceae bacterium]
MGNDQLFKKRDKKENYGRKNKNLSPKSRILIVCEGKTEVFYIDDLIKDFSIDKKVIYLIVSKDATEGNDPDKSDRSKPNGSDLQSLIKYAEDNKEKFDYIFCVCDKDAWGGQAFISVIKQAEGSGIRMIVSEPCFEYWILLHFEYTTEGFQRMPGEKYSDRVISSIKKHISSYEKGNRSQDIYKQLKGKMENAIKNSKMSFEGAKNDSKINTKTNFHDLIEFLRDLVSKKC